MAQHNATLPSIRRSTEVADFIERIKQAPATYRAESRRRLIIAFDATASRQALWDHACQIQGEMFEATTALGGIEIQLVFYRGYEECKASRWLTTAADLHRVMSRVSCVGGHTQIGRVLTHAIRETRSHKVDALIFVGDAMEEQIDELCHHAGELGRQSVPIFVLQDGDDSEVAAAFRQIASLSQGAYLDFDSASIGRLKELLGAVAVYVAGGSLALAAYAEKTGCEVLRLTYRS
jgi:hypothetical protein